MKFHESISVVVPVYNEATLVENAIFRINDFLRTSFADFEIIIIESGSRDGTDKLCDKLSKRFKRVKIIHEGSKKGYGSALKKGFRVARWDLIWPITVDFPFPLKSIFGALPLLAEYDCVLSYRSSDNRSLSKKVQSFIYNHLAKLALGIRFRHINSAFKLFKQETLSRMKLRSNGWFLDTEILYNLTKKNFRCTEIPVPLIENREKGSSVGYWGAITIFFELVKFFIEEKV